MNAKQILTIFVISILMFFSGCNSLKRRIVVGQEKVGVEGEDYTLHYYKRKIGSRGFLKINVTEYGEPLSKNEITIKINGINILGREEPSYYLDVNKKYNFYIMGVGAGKYLYINNVKVREGDSIILNVHLKDTLWIE